MINNALFIYLFKSSLISGIFYAYYVLVLRNNRFHQYNRFYLLISMLLSLVIPILPFSIFSVDEKQIQGAGQVIYLVAASTSAQPEHVSWINLPWLDYVTGIICLISIALVSYFIYQVFRIYQLKMRYPSIPMQGILFIETEEEEAPFSFLQLLFWKKSISLTEEHGQAIFKHELTHIQQKHTIDRIICQIITSVFWINPFNWLIHRELQNIHEFIADQEAVGSNNVQAFAQMILQSHYGNHFLNPSHSFYYSSIKRRIVMLTTSQNTSYEYARKVLALPIAFLAIAIFSLQVRAQEKPEISAAPKISITAVKNAPNKPSKPGKPGVHGLLPPPPTPPLAHPATPGVPPPPPVPPLYVIDGKIQKNVLLNQINPADILSVNVLKGSQAISQYGQEGKNGVVEIITKKNSPASEASSVIEEPASYPGGVSAFQAFLLNHLQYPEQAKKANISGKAYVQFTVEVDGSLSDIKVLRSPGFGLGEEAVRIIRESGKWIPAKSNDVSVVSQIVQPVAFSLGK